MHWKRKSRVVMVLVMLLLIALPAASVLAEDECPPGNRIYIGGPVEDADAVRGSKDNPAEDGDEAYDLCMKCGGGFYIYEYQPLSGEYPTYSTDTCGEVFPDTGIPLSQSAMMIVLGLFGGGLLAWGLYKQWQLNRSG